MPRKRTDTARIVARAREDSATLVCWFCEHTREPDYKEIEVLKGFLSPRGKILGKKSTGVCSKHQRSLARAIKNARQLALI